MVEDQADIASLKDYSDEADKAPAQKPTPEQTTQQQDKPQQNKLQQDKPQQDKPQQPAQSDKKYPKHRKLNMPSLSPTMSKVYIYVIYLG